MFSLGEIAKRAKCEVHRVRYVIDSRDIKHIKKVGNARLFGDEAVRQILAELAAMEGRRRK